MVLENTVRAVIRRLKEYVTPNVVQMTHADYGEIASLPAVILYTPRVDEVASSESNERNIQRDVAAGTFRASPPPKFYRMVFDYEVVTDTPIGDDGLYALIQRSLRFLTETPEIAVQVGNEVERFEVRPALTVMPGTFSPTLQTARGSFSVLVRVDDQRYAEGPLIKRMQMDYANDNSTHEKREHWYRRS